MLGRVLVAIAVGVIAFIIALIVGGIFHLATLVAYAGLIGLAVAVIWFFGYHSYRGPRGPVV